jgi:hypothetical protein
MFVSKKRFEALEYQVSQMRPQLGRVITKLDEVEASTYYVPRHDFRRRTPVLAVTVLRRLMDHLGLEHTVSAATESKVGVRKIATGDLL